MEGESALSLVARTVARPILYGDHPLFNEQGLKFKEIVEVSGEAGSGKTLLISDLIASCVLPKTLGGYEAEVILVDCDSQFCVIQIASMLEASILERLSSKPDCFKSDMKISQALEDSLKRINLFTSHDLETLLLQFHYFKTYLISNPNIGVVMLDNMTSFYWRQVQFSQQLRRMDSYLAHVLNYLYTQLSSFNVAVIYTRPSYFQSKNAIQRELSNTYNLKNVNTYVNLSYVKKEGSTIYTALVKRPNDCFSKSFKVSDNSQLFWL